MTVRTFFAWTSADIGILVVAFSVFSHDGSALWLLREEECSPALPVDWILCQLKGDSLDTVFNESQSRSVDYKRLDKRLDYFSFTSLLQQETR